MKTFYTLLFFLSSLFATAQTSVYHEFPDSNAVWNIDYSPPCGFFEFWTYHYSIVLTGDTTINAQTYKKLEIPIYEVESNGGCNMTGNWTSPGRYYGSYREDVFNRKVYFIPPSHNTEELLFDFTMQVGDTVQGYLESTAYPKDVVLSIDSILIGSSYRKVWSINHGWGMSIIEGIGSTLGLAEFSPGNTVDGPGWLLSCFKQNDNAMYPDSTTACDLINAIQTLPALSKMVSVFPNPSYGKINLQFETSTTKIELTDVLGNKVFSRQFMNENNYAIENLPAGTYTLTAFDKSGYFYRSTIISLF